MPKKYTKKIISLLLVLTCIGLFPNAAYTQTDPKADAETLDIARQIKAQQEAIQKIQDQIDDYEKRVQSKRTEALSLKNQLTDLQDSIEQARLQLDLKRQQITELNLTIKETEKRIEEKNKELEKHRERISEFTRLLYQRGQKNYIEILLANDVFSDFFDEQQYLKTLEGDIGVILKKVKAVKASLDQQRQDLTNEKATMEALRDDLLSKQATLEEKITAKNVILEATQADEGKFQQMLTQVRAEQAGINATIVNLEKKLREKLIQNGDTSLDAFSGQGFIWPLSSKRVTARFHDPSYPFRRYFEHPAIDIGTPQGTPIKAIASGYVSVAHDGGLGYSYISIVHANGFSSVYGHVSCILVSEDEFVLQGQSIGCTGATPGTPGAGNLTTGPHLHLEIRLNGIPVNPQTYLP